MPCPVIARLPSGAGHFSRLSAFSRICRLQPAASNHRDRGGRPAVSGKRTVNVLPTPTWLVTAIVPPICSTTFFEMARPSPRPRRFVVTKSSKIDSRRSAGCRSRCPLSR